MTALLAAGVQAPVIEYGALSPFLVLAGGMIATILVALIGRPAFQRVVTPLTATLVLVAAGVAFVLRLGHPDPSMVSGALQLDDLALMFDLIFVAAALCATVIAWRSETLRETGRGEFYALLITAVLGMALVASATNMVTFFIAFELMSIPLYVLCAADLRRNGSLESGLKYLILGSIGSAVLLYGFALLYGATGSTDFAAAGRALQSPGIGGDTVALVGAGLLLVGLAFKASVAPFHHWTPDVYEGAPTPVTAFMAVATKLAVVAALLRMDVLLLDPLRDHWKVVLSVLAVTTIVVGNLGALDQQSLKRMLAYSGVAQVGYLLVGVVVGLWISAYAIVFYAFAYLAMNIGPFAVIAARERAGAGDGLRGMRDLGREAPWLAWPMTICMLALAGLPVTTGFVGKLLLVQSAIAGGEAWLGVAIVVGSAISLGYYLKVVAAIWMPAADRATAARPLPAQAGAAPAADPSRHVELVTLAVVAATVTVIFGFLPQPLLDLAHDAAAAFVDISR